MPRIIPADAGSTSLSNGRIRAKRDHPRGCGEHGNNAPKIDITPGIIPADAGSTHYPYPTDRPPRDHPRGCGEHRTVRHHGRRSGGSSPRMRGAPVSPIKYLGDLGIIPADAGSTMRLTTLFLSVRDHPRGCGEHGTCAVSIPHCQGSSPRMRGALKGRPFDPIGFGIIPADAGSTWTESAYSNPHGDHPRGCGEHHPSTPTVPNGEGSSPRMRGAPSHAATKPIRAWIIPADAGSTGKGAGRWFSNTDHPRGCGEH